MLIAIAEDVKLNLEVVNLNMAVLGLQWREKKSEMICVELAVRNTIMSGAHLVDLMSTFLLCQPIDNDSSTDEVIL